MDEQWKIIGEAPNYAVSNFGRIKNVKTDRIRKASPTNLGYLQVGLNQNGKTIFRLVHRLVAQAFIPNPEELPEVNHKDFNKNNNSVDNLEWVNHKTNMTHNWHGDNPNKIINEVMRVVKETLNKYITY
jgi:hypothetical protein